MLFYWWLTLNQPSYEISLFPILHNTVWREDVSNFTANSRINDSINRFAAFFMVFLTSFAKTKRFEQLYKLSKLDSHIKFIHYCTITYFNTEISSNKWHVPRVSLLKIVLSNRFYWKSYNEWLRDSNLDVLWSSIRNFLLIESRELVRLRMTVETLENKLKTRKPVDGSGQLRWSAEKSPSPALHTRSPTHGLCMS